MAYDFLGLVNDVNKRLNEIELTTSNFASTTGFYSLAKDAVNYAIRHVNHEEFEWPWNHVEEEQTLSDGDSRYPYPDDCKTINMNSFRIKRDSSLNVGTVKLKPLTYEEYLDKYIDNEYNSNTSIQSVPEYIVRAPSREFILVPTPDQDYELVFEYYRLGFDLELHNDVPSLPESYRHVIIDGAMYYVYQFRSDTALAQASEAKFKEGIKHLRSLHINRTDYIRDTRVHY